MARGSIVEYQISTDASPALPETGVMRRITVFDEEQLERFYFELAFPKGAPLQTASQQIAAELIHRSSDRQSARLERDLGTLKPRKRLESNLPFDASARPYFQFSQRAICGSRLLRRARTSWRSKFNRPAKMRRRRAEAR